MTAMPELVAGFLSLVGLAAVFVAISAFLKPETFNLGQLGNIKVPSLIEFMKIWKSNIAKDTKKYILKTKCNCTYECALTYNILGNWRYQGSLMSSLFNI